MFTCNSPFFFHSRTKNADHFRSHRQSLFSLKSSWTKLLLPAFCICCVNGHAISLPASNLKLRVEGGTVVLTWTGSAGVLYQPEGAPGPTGPWQAIGSPTTSFAATNVFAGSSQVFRVGIFTNTVEYVANGVRNTGDKDAPSVPSGLTAYAASCSQLNLSWNASIDQGTKVGGTTYTSGLKAYNIYRGGVFLKQVLAPVTATADTGLNGSTTYVYSVLAIDNAGNSSSLSGSISATTPACSSCTVSISTSASPLSGGSVSGSGTVICGASRTVTATANPGYNFGNWTENGTVVSTSAAYTFSANANRVLVANFSAASTGSTKGHWTFDNTSISGTTAMDSSGTGNNATLIGNPLPTIVPGKTNQAVSLDGSSGLVAVPDSPGLNITGPFTAAAWVNLNTLPGLTQYPVVVGKLSSPSSCYGFGIGWNGSGMVGIVGSGLPSWTVTPVTPAPAVGAWNHYAVVFDGTLLKLYLNGALYSQTSASAPASTAGSPVKMGAHYSDPSVYGYINGKLDDVRIYNQALTASDIASMYSSAGTGSPSYISINTTSSPLAAGSTTGGGTITVGSSVTVSAFPNAGYSFVNWTENGTVVSSSASYSFTGNNNRTLVANFALVPCTFSLVGNIAPAGAGTVVGAGLVSCGSTVTMTATPNLGYSFANWTENGIIVSTSPIYTFAATISRSLVANFSTTPLSYTITTASSPISGGSTAGGRSASSGSAITVTATPSAGYNFVNWTENGLVVSSSQNYSFTVLANRNLMANFSAATSSGPWAKRFGGSGNDSASAVAVDNSGNIFLGGSFKGSADFGGSLLTSSGGQDMVLAKYSSSGVHQWSYRFGGAGDETVKAIALDSSGNIFVAGYFTGSGNFGGSTFTSAGQYNSFLAKYSASGQHLWSKSFGSTSSTTYIDLFNALALDSQGNVVVTGTFQGDASFGGASLHSQWGTAVNTVLAKYSTDGTHLWSKNFASGNENYANGIAIDRSDNIILTGSFFTSVNFASNDGVDRTITSVAPTYQNIFVAKFTRDGSHIWSKRFGGANGDKGISVATDGNGDVLVGGMFYKQTDLGNGTLIGGALDLDSFVAKYSGADGSYRWAVTIVGNNGCWVNAVKCDSQNNVVLTGYYYGTFNFRGQSLTSTLNSYDGYAAKYNSAGGLTWVSGFGGSASDGGSAIAIDASNHPIISGAFNGTATIGGTALVSAGMGDAFLMQLNP